MQLGTRRVENLLRVAVDFDHVALIRLADHMRARRQAMFTQYRKHRVAIAGTH